MRMLQRFTAALLVSTAALALAIPALGHGGEDHSEDAAKVVSEAGSKVVRTATAHEMEIVVKHDAVAPDTPWSAELFLTDAATNAPIADAKLTLIVGSVRTSAAPAEIPGMSVADVTAQPAGTYELAVQIERGGETFDVKVGALTVAQPAAAPAGGRFAFSPFTLVVSAFFLVVAGIWLVALWPRIARRRNAVAIPV